MWFVAFENCTGRFGFGHYLSRNCSRLMKLRLQTLGSVILKRFFCAKDLLQSLIPDGCCGALRQDTSAALAEESYTARPSDASRGILRANEALQDDRFYTMSVFSERIGTL
jgi:hypothetical protein